jgi:hypothetical protein
MIDSPPNIDSMHLCSSFSFFSPKNPAFSMFLSSIPLNVHETACSLQLPRRLESETMGLSIVSMMVDLIGF